MESLAQFGRFGLSKPGMQVTGEKAERVGFHQFRESFASVLAKQGVASL
jgi:hypothetical protein